MTTPGRILQRNSDMVRLVSELIQSDEPVSGERLAARFGISRAALQKKVDKLRAAGFVVEAQSGVGYRLETVPDRLDGLTVLPRLDTQWMGWALSALEECGSTNDEAKSLAQRGEPAGLVVTTERQTAGRGRRGRTWHSPAGRNIAMSILLRPDLAPQDAGLLTLMTAVAAAEAVSAVTGLRPTLKWPNDILLHGKKLCGILTEMAADPERIDWVVVGIGCNVNTESFPEDIAETATSLQMVLGRAMDRAALAAALLTSMETWHDRLVAQGAPSILNAWKRSPNILGRTVTVHPPPPAGPVTGVAEDLAADGSLLLRLPDGGERIVLAGDLVVEN